MTDLIVRVSGAVLALLLIARGVVMVPQLFNEQPEGDIYIGGDLASDDNLLQDYCTGATCQQLNPSDIEEAAQPLMDRGASVVVILDSIDTAALIVNPDSGREAFFTQLTRLGYVDEPDPLAPYPAGPAGFLKTGQPNLIGVYIGLSLLGSEDAMIVYGADWSEELSPYADTIVDEQLVPGLESNQYSTAIADTLVAIDAHLPVAAEKTVPAWFILADNVGIVLMMLVLMAAGFMKFRQSNAAQASLPDD